MNDEIISISNGLFRELTQAAIEVWRQHSNCFGYVDDKIHHINNVTNIFDDWGMIVGMFNAEDQRKLYEIGNDEIKKLVVLWTGRKFK